MRRIPFFDLCCAACVALMILTIAGSFIEGVIIDEAQADVSTSKTTIYTNGDHVEVTFPLTNSVSHGTNTVSLFQDGNSNSYYAGDGLIRTLPTGGGGGGDVFKGSTNTMAHFMYWTNGFEGPSAANYFDKDGNAILSVGGNGNSVNLFSHNYYDDPNGAAKIEVDGCTLDSTNSGVFFDWNSMHAYGLPLQASGFKFDGSQGAGIVFLADDNTPLMRHTRYNNFQFDQGGGTRTIKFDSFGQISEGLTVEAGACWLDGVPFVSKMQDLTGGVTNTIDFQGSMMQRIVVDPAGAVLTTVNRHAVDPYVSTTSVVLVNTNASAVSLTLPAWIFLNAAGPTNLPAGKTAVLSLSDIGANETDVVAAYGAQQ